MGRLKKHLPNKRRYRVYIYLLSSFLLLLAADMLLVQFWRHITVGVDTTRIPAAFIHNGVPDYVAARNTASGVGVTPENNAAPQLLQITGTEEIPESWRTQVLPQLGLPVAGSPSQIKTYSEWVRAHFPAPASTQYADAAANDERLRREEDAILKFPWKSTDYPLAAQWLDEQHEIITRLHTVLEMNRFYIPWPGDGPASIGATLKMDLPWLSKPRACSHLLIIDALRAAGDGDAATFNRDILDATKIARLVGQGSCIIEYLVDVAIDAHASLAIENSAHLLPASAAGELLRERRSLPPLTTPSTAIDVGERYLALDALSYSAAYGFDRYAQHVAQDPRNVPLHPVARLLLPWHFNASMKITNHYFDELLAAYALPTYKQQAAARTMLNREIETLRHHWSITDIFLATLIPSLGATLEQHETAVTHRALAEISLALFIYHNAHNEFPESLTALSPDLLPAIPADGFADAPFHYKRTPEGYFLYSVGPDGIDDGGRERNFKSHDTWDIVVKFPR